MTSALHATLHAALRTALPLFLALVLPARAAPGMLPAAPDAVSFRVAQYNIRVAAAADEKSGNGWDIRKTPLAQLITRHDFDIVGTQEGNARQLEDLDALLPAYARTAAPYAGKRGDSHNCAIYYKRALFERITTGTFWFSETPDEPSIGWDATDRRICHWAKLREKKSGREFYFLTAHFYWKNVTARQNSGPLMVRKIKEIAGDAPVILTGDLNSKPETRQILAIKKILADAYDTTQTPRKGPDGTGFPGGVFQGKPGARIDYILTSPHFDVLDYLVLTDTYNGDHHPSDHLPVTTRLTLKK
ncbi:MAG: endonuclease/exonuclease/phosphatase family protein [Opitutaceae bacterium]|jgi:endonuclease/exonuclease/phosphatase family metal-dependent hydrolase|nr:endonuclease/exonuclease/phosphatase family protein [Opitutaceae bacterium]